VLKKASDTILIREVLGELIVGISLMKDSLTKD